MQVDAKDAKELLETLALNHAAEFSLHGEQHASRVAKLAVSSWQAEIIRASNDIAQAENPEELRSLMADRDCAVIFLPQSAMVTAEIIDRICRESTFDKMIVWETND
ncbi:MAG: hypothetical protein GC185_06550 [Alphaproteobacteria bacterium]|nr:hypothetical protein [Alphaproteobacteria bacterium]